MPSMHVQRSWWWCGCDMAKKMQPRGGRRGDSGFGGLAKNAKWQNNCARWTPQLVDLAWAPPVSTPDEQWGAAEMQEGCERGHLGTRDTRTKARKKAPKKTDLKISPFSKATSNSFGMEWGFVGPIKNRVGVRSRHKKVKGRKKGFL